ncbi:MAG: hypothetical protein AAGM84_00545 [Pseudomonadota bacterium]
MRLLALLILAAPAAHAWEFSPSPICTLTHAEDGAEITVTYDHGSQLYAVDVTAPYGWPDAPAFSMRFDGPRPNTISTARHQTQGNTLTVTDTGFGNVLDGLEFNRSATAFTQTAAVTFSLDGAAEPVQRFRDCTKTPLA